MEIEYFALLVAILSAVIALTAIFRASEANRISRETNEIAKHYNLRPGRLGACNLLQDYTHYCTTYTTLFRQKFVSGTTELLDRRDAFRSKFQAFGPLGMPDIEAKATEVMSKAVQLQRCLDRTRGSNPKSLDAKYSTVEVIV